MKIEITKDLLKAQIKILREYLKAADFELSQSSAYHAVSKMYGFENWNTLSAHLKEETKK